MNPQSDYISQSRGCLLHQCPAVYSLACIMPDTVLSAAAVINFLSLLLFWARHLPLHLPSPVNRHPVYRHFYQTMQDVSQLSIRHPQSLPQVTEFVHLRTRFEAPEDLGAAHSPPNPRPPRDGVSAEQASPEARPARPAPPPPRTPANRRKASFPKKRE